MSTYTSLLRCTVQADGENTDTWGDVFNAGVLALLEAAIAGAASLNMALGDVTLSTVNGAPDQARLAALQLTGVLSGNRVVNVPASTKMYVVANDTTGAFSATIKTSAGTGVVVAQGDTIWVWCDGTNVRALKATPSGAIDAATLGGVIPADYARVDTAAFFKVAGLVAAPGVSSSAGHYATDASLGCFFPVALTDSGVLDNPTNLPANIQGITWRLAQDATGGRQPTYGTKFKFAGGSAPLLTGTANAVDYLQGVYNPASGNVEGCTLVRNCG